MGGELFNRVVERRKFPEPTAKLYMYQICVAIEYLHARGMAHRDISLENVLLTDGPEETCVRVMKHHQ